MSFNTLKLVSASVFSLCGMSPVVGQCAWSEVGGGLNGSVNVMEVFDDGSGPSLYAGGAFRIAGGVFAERIAEWDGSTWAAMGPSGYGMDNQVWSMTIHDEHFGPALYAGGAFNSAGFVPGTGRIAKWDGTSWSGVGITLPYPVTIRAMAVFDDGGGPLLYAGGNFISIGNVAASGVAKWNGATWTPLADGTDGSVFALCVYDDGSGPALYVGGEFRSAGGVVSNGIAKWDGNSWSPVAGGVGGGGAKVLAMTVFDDGTGPALYLGGDFITAGSTVANYIVKWDGVAWSPLGVGTNQCVKCFTVFDDGSGSALYAGGIFTFAGGFRTDHVARWDGASWSAMDGGTSSDVLALKVFDEGAGPALFAGGHFNTAGGASAMKIARWSCSACYPDCDANGALDIFDFLCFQNSFVAGEPYACDCDPDPACDVFDFLCFQNAFVPGCP